MSNPDPDASQVLERCLHEIGEHFDAVQIMATRMDGQTTLRCIRGCGNFYASLGMAQEFIQEDAAKESAKLIASELKPPEED